MFTRRLSGILAILLVFVAAPTRARNSTGQRRVEDEDRATIVKDEAETNAVIADHPEILKIPHVTSMSATGTFDEDKGYSGPEIVVFVDEKENVKEVEKAVPNNLHGIPVVVMPVPRGVLL